MNLRKTRRIIFSKENPFNFWDTVIKCHDHKNKNKKWYKFKVRSLHPWWSFTFNNHNISLIKKIVIMNVGMFLAIAKQSISPSLLLPPWCLLCKILHPMSSHRSRSVSWRLLPWRHYEKYSDAFAILNKSQQTFSYSNSTIFIHCWLGHYFPTTQSVTGFYVAGSINVSCTCTLRACSRKCF